MIVALLVLLVVAGVLRFKGLDDQGLWFDEIWHVELSNGWDSASFLQIPINRYIPQQQNYVKLANARPWHTIPQHMDYVLQPPLYHMLLRPWRAVVGESPACLRGFSALMSLCAVALTFEAARRCAGAAVGLGAAAMMALSISQIDSAHDCRGYALLIVLSLPTAIALQSLLDENVSPRSIAVRSAGVAIGTLVMMFTHYFASGACLGMGFFAAIFLRGRARWMTLAGMAIAAAVYLVLWFPSLRQQLDCIKETADIFLLDPTPGHPLRTIRRLLALPMLLMADTEFAAQTSAMRIALGAALLAIAGIAIARHKDRPQAALWAFWFAGTVGVVATVDLLRHSLHLSFVRYVLLASPGLFILLSLPLADIAMTKNGWRGMVTTISILALELALLAGGSAVHIGDVRPLCAYVQEHAQPGDVLVLPARHHLGHDAHALSLDLAYYTDRFPTPMIVATRAIDAATRAQAPPGAKWWLVSTSAIELDHILPGAKVLEAQSFEAVNGVGIAARVQLPSTTTSATQPIDPRR